MPPSLGGTVLCLRTVKQVLQGLVAKAQEQAVLEDAAAQGHGVQSRFFLHGQAGPGNHAARP